MNIISLDSQTPVSEIVACAHGSNDPVLIRDGGDDCLVCMSPAVFERILFEGTALNSLDRASMHW